MKLMILTLNCVLSWFGLMKISRARELTRVMHVFYAECVVNGVKEDFNALPAKHFQSKGEAWWLATFDQILLLHHDKVRIGTIAKFEDLVTNTRLEL